MVGVRAEHVYLALQHLNYRYGTEIIQGFTDKGSQLGRTLGKRSDYWCVKIDITQQCPNIVISVSAK